MSSMFSNPIVMIRYDHLFILLKHLEGHTLENAGHMSYGATWTAHKAMQDAQGYGHTQKSASENEDGSGGLGSCILLLFMLFAAHCLSTSVMTTISTVLNDGPSSSSSSSTFLRDEPIPSFTLARFLLHNSTWRTSNDDASTYVDIYLDAQLHATFEFSTGGRGGGFVALTPSICLVLDSPTRERLGGDWEHGYPKTAVFDRDLSSSSTLDINTLIWDDQPRRSRWFRK